MKSGLRMPPHDTVSNGAELPDFTDNTGKLHTTAETEGGGTTVRLTMEGRIETDNSLALTADLKELLELPVPRVKSVFDLLGFANFFDFT